MAVLAWSLLCLSLAFPFLFSISVSGQKEGEDIATCPSPEPVGFTALSPQQLQQEIRNAVGRSLSGSLQMLMDRLSQSESNCYSHIILVEELLTELKVSLIESHERFVQILEALMDRRLDSRLEELVNNLTTTFQKALDLPPSLPTSLPPTPPLPSSALGLSSSNPALSCQQVLDFFPTSPSGYYWVAGLGSGKEDNASLPRPVRVYCSMQQTCGDKLGGWMRVAHIDMTNTSHSCPPGGSFVEWSTLNPPRRLCIPNSNASGCFSHRFPVIAVGAGVDKICGRILGYQNRTPNAFFPFHVNPTRTINDIYMDGISLTHGRSARTHIWTFVAALDETAGHLSGCRCSNNSGIIPSFVGQDYFCDTGSRDRVKFQFYAEDPLWDGKGCGSQSSCCSFNKPPWFTKDVNHFPVGDSIEMRVCRDAGQGNENIPFQLVELYMK